MPTVQIAINTVSSLGFTNPFGVIIATVAGIPMYADIFGTIPIAEALLAKGAQLGVVLIFDFYRQFQFFNGFLGVFILCVTGCATRT